MFATDDWREGGKDADYTGPIYGLSFDEAGRLADPAGDKDSRERAYEAWRKLVLGPKKTGR